MKPVYIHCAVCISAQPTFESEDIIAEFTEIEGKKVEAIHPNYKEFISPIALRRMATGVKMGVAAASKALQKANLNQADAILTGTGMGCIEDTEKFLNTILANEEAFLTPTSFIQSTHNTVGAQIALGLRCKAYNNTYVHGAISFESALIDAQLLLQQEEASTVLVGGMDELGTEFVDAVRLMEDKTPQGIKVPIGEGATFFVLSSEDKNEAIQFLDIETYSKVPKDAIVEKAMEFLRRNQLKPSDIDVLVLGCNGDAFDSFYTTFRSGFSEATTAINYKKWSGEYYTASAFGLYIAHEILKAQVVPNTFLPKNTAPQPAKTVLLYNQFKGRDHSFILLTSC